MSEAERQEDTGTEEEAKQDSVEKLVEAVAAVEADKIEADLEVTFSSGVVLELRPVPKNFIYQVTAQFHPPEVPTVWLEKKQRHEENPNDPRYITEMELYAVEVANAATDASILRGSKAKSIPDDIPGPDAKEWVEEMELLGLPLVDSSRARYLAWVKGIACPLDNDILSLLEALGRLTGVAESDVLDAVRKFRRAAERGSDNGTAGSGN